MEFNNWLQSRLTAHGLPVDSDGIWDRPDIVAIKAFQKVRGLTVNGVSDAMSIAALRAEPDGNGAVVPAPAEAMPPWMAEMLRRIGLHEARDNAVLSAWLKIGRFLGNPANQPWCGDAVESCVAKTLPAEPLPANPFFAQAWAKFGTDVVVPLVGAIGVIRLSGSSGHVGIVSGIESSTIYLLGGNQSNAINVSGFPRSKFIAFRWPNTYTRKSCPPLKGKATGVLTETSTR